MQGGPKSEGVGMGSPRVNFGAKAQVLLYKDVKSLQFVIIERVDT